MTFASDIFPQLPSKDLFDILIKIFLYLNEDKDIHTYRLVNRGWKAFIDNEILGSPAFRRKFLQHPLSLPAEQRKPLIKANLCEDLGDGGCPDSDHRHSIFDKGQYVLITTTSINGNDSHKVKLWIFRKTNVDLKAVGHVELTKRPLERLGKNVFAMYQDYLFYVELTEHPSIYQYQRLQVFKNENNTWNPFQHPARYLWEEEGAQVIGMRQVSDNKVFLLVALEKEGLIKVYNLCDGRLELSVDYVLSKKIVLAHHLYSSRGSCTGVFDMDAFGLVIQTDSWYLQHFSFAGQRKIWEVENIGCGETVKLPDATLVHCIIPREITIRDNATGAVTNTLSYKRLPDPYFPSIIPSGKYIIFHGSRSGDFFFLQGPNLQATYSLVVYDVQESKLMCLPVKIPGIVFHWGDCLLIHDVTQLSDTTVICSSTVFLRSRGTYPCIIMLSLTHPVRMTVLPYNHVNVKINATVPCDYGFFAVGHQWNTTQPPTSFHLFSLKY